MPRHPRFVRLTHWLTAAAFLALLVTGGELILSHPRFYWGESGNVNTAPLFALNVPSSRSTVPTSYSYGLPDQNGWSRNLHFQSAWLLLLTAFVYLVLGLRTGHFRKSLVGEASGYNPRQRIVYLGVIFILFPLVIWTGLAMAPAFTAIFPSSVTALGGRQSARTMHFIVTVLLLLFMIVHLTMIALAGFWTRTRPMITGTAETTR
jgi:thiosulfate reductase cytochrome b subunit